MPRTRTRYHGARSECRNQLAQWERAQCLLFCPVSSPSVLRLLAAFLCVVPEALASCFKKKWRRPRNRSTFHGIGGSHREAPTQEPEPLQAPTSTAANINGHVPVAVQVVVVLHWALASPSLPKVTGFLWPRVFQQRKHLLAAFSSFFFWDLGSFPDPPATARERACRCCERLMEASEICVGAAGRPAVITRTVEIKQRFRRSDDCWCRVYVKGT